MINLSPGPAPLPRSVMSAYLNALANNDLIGRSHRSLDTQRFIRQLQSKVLETLMLPDHYEVLFLAGSSRETTQKLFKDFENQNKAIDHFVTGYWSEWASRQTNQSTLSEPELLHVCLNETVNGVFIEKAHALPTISDVTSCLFTCHFKQKAAIWYASGQKIFSMPGFSLVILDKNMIDSNMGLYPYLISDSSCVTPPLYGMLLLDYFLDWLAAKGGITALEDQTKQRAMTIYSALEKKDMNLVESQLRSMTSLVFDGKTHEQTAALIDHMSQQGVIGFKNHRAVGGMRIMNLPGLEQQPFEKLVQLIEDFV